MNDLKRKVREIVGKHLPMQRVAIWLIVLSLLFLLTSIINPAFKAFQSGIYNPELADHFGSFVNGIIGPILSLASILLLLTSLKDQRVSSERSEFKLHIYELLKYNRETIKSFEYQISSDSSGSIHAGPRYFIWAKRQIEDSIAVARESLSQMPPRKQIEVGYVTFYFGVTSESEAPLLDALKTYMSDDAAKMYIEIVRLRRAAYNKHVLYFGGHQEKLGHYFRQLYFIVKEIDQNNVLTQAEKKNYAKLLRVQLSTYEQAVLFFNSISVLGNDWAVATTEGDSVAESLIEKYDLIKNIPKGFTKGIDPRDIYTNIDYE